MNTNDNLTGLIIKRPVTLTMIVTPRWKEEVEQQLKVQIDQIDAQVKQIDTKVNQATTELQKQNVIAASPQINQQIQSIQSQASQQKNELLKKKNQLLQQMEQVQQFELNQEVKQNQPLESFCRVEVGDNLVQKMNNVEIVMRDGIVEEIRGNI